MSRSVVLLTMLLLGGALAGCQHPAAPFLTVTAPDVPDTRQPLDSVRWRPWVDQRTTLIATSQPPKPGDDIAAAAGPASELRIVMKADGSLDGPPVLVVRRNGRVVRTGLLLGKLEVTRFPDHVEIAGDKLQWSNGSRSERLVTFKLAAPNIWQPQVVELGPAPAQPKP